MVEQNIKSRPLRILFLSTEYPPETGGGGIGTYVKTIVNPLANLGHKVHVISCSLGQQERDYLDGNVYIHRFPQIRIRGVSRLGHITRTTRALTRLLNALSNYLAYRKLRVNFDIIEYPDWNAEGLFFSLLHFKPLVAHLHTPLPLIVSYSLQKETLDSRLAGLLEQAAVKRADVITSPTKALATDVAKCFGIDTGSVEIIPHPIDITEPPTTEAGTCPARVLFVGRLETLKNPEVIIRAVPLVLKKVPEAEFIFIGKEGTFGKWLQKLASELGVSHAVRFEEYKNKEEIRTYREMSRVCVVPSLYESFGYVVLEGMVSARPVVVSNKGGIPEIIRNGEIGKLLDPLDVQGWAESIIYFLENPDLATVTGQRAREYVARYYNPIDIAKQRENVYRKAISIHRQRRAKKIGNFLWALPRYFKGMEIPQHWRKYVVSNMLEHPWYHFYLHTARQLLDLIGVPLQDKEILDMGCTPAVSVLLGLLGAKVTMVDIDKRELEKARILLHELELDTNVNLVQADLFRSPFSKHFDIVLNSGVVEHFPDPVSVLRIMGRAARSGGIVVVLVPNHWTPHTWFIRPWQRCRGEYYWDYMGKEKSYTKAQLEKLFEVAGLRVIKTVSGNLRRSILDDCLVSRFSAGRFTGHLVFRAMNLIDFLEAFFPVLQIFGFMVGAVGIKPKK